MGLKKYSEQFKIDAVNLVLKQGYGNTDAARAIGVHESTIRKWKIQMLTKDSKNGGKNKNSEALIIENNHLKKENKKLVMERDILKKAAAFFAKEQE